MSEIDEDKLVEVMSALVCTAYMSGVLSQTSVDASGLTEEEKEQVALFVKKNAGSWIPSVKKALLVAQQK